MKDPRDWVSLSKFSRSARVVIGKKSSGTISTALYSPKEARLIASETIERLSLALYGSDASALSKVELWEDGPTGHFLAFDGIEIRTYNTLEAGRKGKELLQKIILAMRQEILAP